jgi:hypothetical protein
MSIGKRVSEAIEKMEASDPEGALFQICAAVDVTAQVELGKPGKGSYKDFLHQNLGLITRISSGRGSILNFFLKYDHPKIAKAPNGLVSIQDIFYHVVRCGLYHEAGLPGDLKFTDEGQFRVDHGVLVMPSTLIYGLVTAVVVSPVNHNERAQKDFVLNLGNFPVPISKLWGRRDELTWLLDVEKEVYEMQLRTRETK